MSTPELSIYPAETELDGRGLTPAISFGLVSERGRCLWNAKQARHLFLREPLKKPIGRMSGTFDVNPKPLNQKGLPIAKASSSQALGLQHSDYNIEAIQTISVVFEL